MNLQEELKTLKERIAELEYHARKEQEFPQDGDEYWYIDDEGDILNEKWDGLDFEEYRLEIGNIYKTEDEAEFAVEKLKVEAELRKFSRPFEPMVDNFYMVLDTSDGSVDIWCMFYSKAEGAIYFESKKKAIEAIESVGEERVKKYIFGVE